MKNLHRSTRRRWLWATAIAAIIAIVACNKNDDKQAAQLAITTFSPAEAAEGATVVIKGIAFSPDKALNTVKFNGLAAAVSNAAANGTELSVTVPEDATTGKITVTVGDQTVTSTTEFKVNATAPVITTVVPEKGDIGTEVTITGNRFTNTSEVYFGGIKATEVTFVGKTSLKAKLPAGALNGKVKVTAASLEALSAANFWVRPAITGFTAEKAPEGTVIEINGTNFSTVTTENTVYFGTKAATEITEATAIKLKVKVPVDAENDIIKVVVKEQEAVSATKFTLLPTLISFSPASIERGRPLEITGKNFGSAEVWLNGNRLAPYSNTATTIGVTIPNDAVSGKLVIKQSGVDQEFATELRVVNYWKSHDPQMASIIYRQECNFVYNNKLYFAFGYDNASTGSIGFMTQVRSYDPINKVWNHEFDIPATVPLRRVAFSVVKGDKWYFGGGDGPDRRECWVADLTKTGTGAGAYTQLTNLNVGSMYDDAFVLNNEVYLATMLYEKKLYRLDPAANSGKGSWNEVLPLTLPGGLMNSVATINNKAYIQDNQGNFAEFDPAVPSLTSKAGSTYISESGIFAINGVCYNVSNGSLYTYSPGENKWALKAGTPSNDLKIFIINGRVFGMALNGYTWEYIYQ
ncbi:IPT/TIG domain-containing protein [Paraflavitalea sp. CAU 1676]|uniref:IPT/TIG domain-containing protein n=1 Tax=Paraflavitalea sp. CAU 1676 TaxID=3032598 RepID=UPI0023DC9884|nr:IPT/TIG domain-containing protein [Paraflavitalea sp. CAU 1676]MDF2192102.1 IPT/TIG domain-containing protein [Paraflavitalea sp. CAU 1676]